MLTKNENIACDYCGKFIAIDELIEGTAVHLLVTPDSELTKEEYESYHTDCFSKSRQKR